MDDLRGIWADDSATYLVDMRHPVIRQEWEQRQLRLGRLPMAEVSLRERRQFDREMIVKYGVVIGRATKDIPMGSWVHLHVMRSNYDERSSHLNVNTGAPEDTRYE